MTPAEIEVTAQRWHDQQLARAKAAHGDRWAENRDWVSSYVLAEIKVRLVARGWVEAK